MESKQEETLSRLSSDGFLAESFLHINTLNCFVADPKLKPDPIAVPKMASRDENCVRYKAYNVAPARYDSMHRSATTAKSPRQPAAKSNYLPNQNKVATTSFATTSSTNEADRDLMTASLLDCDLDEDIAVESQRNAGDPNLSSVCNPTRGDEQFIGDQNNLSSDLVEQSLYVYQLAYEALEEVSRQIGREQNVRYQNVLPLETLREISTKLPTSEAEMLEIDEVTKVIFDKFGQRYLKVTTEYKQLLEEQRRMQNEVGLFDDLDDENGDHNEAIDSDAVQLAHRPSTSGVRRADCSRGEKRRSGGSGGGKEKRRAASPGGRKEKRRAGSPEGRKEKRRAVSSENSSSVSSSECSFVVSSERSSESSDFEVDTETDDAVRSEYWLRSNAAEERPNENEGQSGRSSRNSSSTDLQDEAVDVLNPSKIYRLRSNEVEIQITMLNTPDAEQKSEWAASCKKLVEQLIRKITNE